MHIPRGAYSAGASDYHIDIRDTVTGKDVMLPRSTASVWFAPKQGSVPRRHPGVEPPKWG